MTTSMRALSLWEPWASLIALGYKTIETRSWATSYRGPIAIHAAKTWDRDLEALTREWPYAALLPPGWTPLRGCVVATATLTGCVRMTAARIDARSAHCDVSDEASLQDQAALNFLLGNWAVGRFAWVLRDIVPLDPPVPAKGAQGVWTWERDDDTNRSTT